MVTEKSNRPDPRQPSPRIYTRRGDSGKTRLAGGREVGKNHPRLNAYGTLDELQVAIGAARDALTQTLRTHPAADLSWLSVLAPHLIYLQNLLFTVSTDLATPLADRRPGMPLATAAHVEYLEKLIDACEAGLPPLREFILPGGHPAATALHLCRVVCRRAEREIEQLAATEVIGDEVRPLVNRLSDAFFVLARRVCLELARAGIAADEQVWQKDLPPPPLPIE